MIVAAYLTGMIYCRFHVDKMSSAHVYLRLHKGQTIDDISEGVLEDCAQLVKANSIQGKYCISVYLFLSKFYWLQHVYHLNCVLSEPMLNVLLLPYFI